MNWNKAQNYGRKFVLELQEHLDGDYSDARKENLLCCHKFMINYGGWSGFEEFNKLSFEEMEDVLGLKEKIGKMKANKVNKPVPLVFCKEDNTDKLEYEDYTELIEYAQSIGDIEWRNELLEREAAL